MSLRALSVLIGQLVLVLAGIAFATPAMAQVRPAQAVDLGSLGGAQTALPTFKNFPKWARIAAQLIDPAMAQETALRPWLAWATALQGEQPPNRLFAINGRVNQRVTYFIDPSNWSIDDYWELPGETLDKASKTDCEGYAIFKYFLALHSGFDKADLYLMAGAIRSTREMHVVLLVRDGSSVYVLDNRKPNVMEISLYDDFVPMYLLNHERAWLVRPRS